MSSPDTLSFTKLNNFNGKPYNIYINPIDLIGLEEANSQGISTRYPRIEPE